MYYNDNHTRRKRVRKKKRRINKPRFAIFSFTTILILSFIFIKFFLPAMSSKRTEDIAKSNNTEWIEKKDDSKEDIIRNKNDKKSGLLEKEDEENTENKNRLDSEDKDKLDKENSDESKDNINSADTNNKAGEYNFDMDSAAGSLIYYNQEDSRWADKLYGPQDPIGTHGCGPTVMATIVSSLTDNIMTPVEMSNWAYENGYCAIGNGSLHSLIPEAAKSFGLKVEPLYMANKEDIERALSEGKIIVELSGHGIFSDEDGHFFIIRELKPNGKVTVSDSVKLEHVYQQWDIETLINEASHISSAGGPFWAISK